MSVTVRYWAAAKAAAGVADEQLDSGGTLASLLDAVRAAHGAELATVLARCPSLARSPSLLGARRALRSPQANSGSPPIFPRPRLNHCLSVSLPRRARSRRA